MTLLWVPIETDDAPSIAALLRTGHPLVTVGVDGLEPYELSTYVAHARAGGDPIRAVLDRNLISRICRLARGASIDTRAPDADRMVAACMAFLIAAQVDLEPNVALYEGAAQSGGAAAVSELADFRVADQVPAQAYANVALGRAHMIHPDALHHARCLVDCKSPQLESVSFEHPLRDFRRHKLVLTKVAQLDRSSLQGHEKFRALLRWSANSAFFDGLAIAFAAVLFGKARQKGMLKHVRSNSHASCIRGIDNASWDLTYIRTWARLAAGSAGADIWLFASFDRACTLVARTAVGRPNDSYAIFAQGWEPSIARRLFDEHQEASLILRSDERASVVHQRASALDMLQSSLDEELAQSFTHAAG